MGFLPVAGVAALVIGLGPASVLAQSAEETPAYVVRGRQTEARQRDYHARIDHFYEALSDALRESAPDLLATLDAPRPDIHGYQILPKLVTDPAPPAPGAKSTVVSYSWGWSDSLFERETRILDTLGSDLTRILATPDLAAYEKLVAGYRAVIATRGPIDSDIQYNWLWQERIARNRPLFDGLKKVQNAVIEREAIEAAVASQDEAKLRAAANIGGIDATQSRELLTAALVEHTHALTRQIVGTTDWVAPQGFVHLEQSTPNTWLLTVPLYTDISDAHFVETFRRDMERLWLVRRGNDEFRVRLAVEVITPERLYCERAEGSTGRANECAPPAKGAAINLETHVARFPPNGAVLTTGATTMQLIAGRAIVLAPYDVTPRVLAHELGHVLGFPDAYFRGYRDVGTDGFIVTELADLSDIMGAPGTGPVTARHFDRLIMGYEVATLMAAGLDALYQRNAPLDAVARFSAVLERYPNHYGATLQLAKALDKAGRGVDALAWWQRILEMAEAAQDSVTTATAKARLVEGTSLSAPAR